MAHYYSLGKIPNKRHIVFRKPNGELYAEQLVSTEGFSDNYSLAYHCYPPTNVRRVGKPFSIAPEPGIENNMQHRSFLGFNIRPEKDFLKSRKIVLYNNDTYISLAAPQDSMKDYFYKNSQADEYIFIHQGEGVLKSIYGKIPFVPGDQLVIPRGTIFQMEFSSEKNRLFIVEAFSPIRFPKKYLSKYGQLMEHAPVYERDIKKPIDLETFDEKGEYLVYTKKDDTIYPYYMASHPFDVIGWDGYHYPYSISIHDFEPITGRIHQPPPVHQIFEAHNFVICNFVPRLFDYHPNAIPVPYNHSNVDSDEVLYYVDGDFMSRKNVSQGQITLHPIGIPHGPQPGMVEKSLGARETKELAVMVDTFRPLKLSNYALEIEDEGYHKSWLIE